jgi:DNA polymerase III delta prime subunit
MDLLNDVTSKWISAFLNRPQSVLLIHSPSDRQQGVAVAKYIFESLRSSSSVQLYSVDLNGKKSLGIDEVRDLKKYVALKTNDVASYSRFILIPDAEKLTPEAQNTLLKLLEEISEKTIIILVATETDSILPTVMSRCFYIQVMPISLLRAKEFGLGRGLSEIEISRAFTISEGRASDFYELLSGNNDSLNKIIALSKEFLKNSIYDRQKLLQKIYAENVNIDEFLQSLQLMARTGMRNSKDANVKLIWKNMLSNIILAQEQIKRNVQSKLVMLALSVSI